MTNVAQVGLVLVCAMVIDRPPQILDGWAPSASVRWMLIVLAVSGGTHERQWVIIFSTVSYGSSGPRRGRFSLHARDLSDP